MIPPVEFLGKTITIYPIMALIGVFVSGIFACKQAVKRGLDDNDMICVLLFCAIGALLGGHMLYGLLQLPVMLQTFRILFTEGVSQAFWNGLIQTFGGSVFYGGLFGAMVTGGLYYKKKGFPPVFADLTAMVAPLFHTFGRIGCFLGGCCYGIPCDFGFIYTQNPIAMANGVRRFPVQLLEALFCFCLFLLLFSLFRRGRCKNRLLALYLGVYSVGRFFLEYLRGDDYRGFLWGLSTSQLISILLLSGVLFYLVAARHKKPAS